MFILLQHLKTLVFLFLQMKYSTAEWTTMNEIVLYERATNKNENSNFIGFKKKMLSMYNVTECSVIMDSAEHVYKHIL